MNLFQRRLLLPFVASTVLAITPLGVHGQDAATAKATFDQVNKHLDLGGQFYAFLNIQGDFTQLGAKAQEIYEKLRQMEGIGDEIPPGLDIAGFLSQLGMDNLEAIGLSSIKFDKGYRNRFFAAIDGERKGLLRLSGGDPTPFAIGEFAPAEAVYAVEWDLDLDGLKDLVTGIGGQLEKSIGMDPLSGVLAQPIPGTELNVSQLLDTLKGRLMAYIVLDEEQILQIPDPNAPQIPGIDLVLSHANGKEVYGHIRSFITSNAPPDAFTEETVDGVTQLQIHLPPQATLGFFAPVIQMTEATGQLVIATRPEALKGLTEGDRLATNADFKRTSDMLPKEGNGYGYVSPKFYEFLEIFTNAASQGNAAIAQIQTEIMSLVYGEPQPMVTMWANQSDGIYSESFAPMSYKISLAYAVIAPAAISGAVIAPMAAKARVDARQFHQRQLQEQRAVEEAARAAADGAIR